VTDVYEKQAVGTNAVGGLEGCLWVGSVAAIQQLLVQEGATAAGVVCDESGWLAESGDRCRSCARLTRRTGDVIDELAARLRFPSPPSSAPG
jgi:hypothetical protein